MHDKPMQRRVKIHADAQGNLPSEIHLLDVGHWHTPWHGAFELTPEDMRQFVSNFAGGVGLVASDNRAPIDYGHDVGGKAAGWITKLYTKNGDSELWGATEWTPSAAQSLQEGEYAYISSEFSPRAFPWTDPENEEHHVDNVLDGAALTNIPLFKKLKPVMASKVTGSSDNSNQGVPNMDLAAIRAKKPEELSEDEKKFLAEHKEDLTDDERKTFGLEAAQPEPTPPAPEPAPAPTPEPAPAPAPEPGKPVQASAQGVMSVEEAEKLKADAAAGRKAMEELTRTKLQASVDAHVRRGAIKSDQRDAVVETLMASEEGEQRDALLAIYAGLPSNELLASKEVGTGADIQASTEVTDAERDLASAFGNTPEEIATFKKNNAGTN